MRPYVLEVTAGLPGSETISDLKDLLAAKDYTIQQTETGFNNFVISHLGSVPDVDWPSDWAAFKDRYATARAAAQSAIDKADANFLAPNSLLSGQPEYDGVLHALKRGGGDIYQKGDLQDLVNRLTAAGGTPDYSDTPQPGQSSAPTSDEPSIPLLPPGTQQLSKSWQSTIRFVSIAGIAIAVLAFVGRPILELALQKE